MAVYTEYRIKYTCDFESELNLVWGEGTIAYCKENGGKWWKIESNVWVEKTNENPTSSGGYDGNPAIIQQNANFRLVTDTEKTTWNGKIPQQFTFIGALTAWTNKTLALQEFLNTNQRRLTIDLTNATQFRITSNVTTQGAAASVTGFQYSIDGGTTFRGLDNGTANTNSTVTLSDLGTGSKVSAWTNLAVGAKADVILRIAGSGGDGTLDPAFSNISLQIK